MQKYVFGLGTAQVAVTLAAIAGVLMAGCGYGGPAAVVVGGGLALSSTAVAMQVLQDRGESGSRHGRAAFAVLLLQDLAVVVLLMLIPLLAPSSSSGGAAAIGRALGLAGVKAAACIVAIMAGGRALVRPLYRRIADAGNADVFAATTLLTVLGTSVLTQVAGLSLALGAFLAGLLLAETEYALQVESDIAPYKGLLMGLFFMTVGMEISVGLFFGQFRLVVGGIAAILVGKTAIMAALGPLFGLSTVASVRAGLLLASGGEFAFVAFGEAVAAKILDPAAVSILFLVVALTMALTPLLADLGARYGRAFDKTDVKALQPGEGEGAALRGHVIIAGFGRVGQIIAQLLAERLIPFVAVDVRVDRVTAGKALDLPVYFGDAGSPAVLHSLGAERAACAVITLDTPGANYRSVWALNKHYPKVGRGRRGRGVGRGAPSRAPRRRVPRAATPTPTRSPRTRSAPTSAPTTCTTASPWSAPARRPSCPRRWNPRSSSRPPSWPSSTCRRRRWRPR
jgi:Kef-type K+ transport system membrane component KefB